MSNIVGAKLIGSTSVTEYAVNGHSIKVLGENHLSGYESCRPGIPTITVADFFLSGAKQAKLLLEVAPGYIDSCPLIGSKNIADIYKAIVAAGYRNKLEGFDTRSILLRSIDQDVLYHKPSQLSTLKADTIASIFVYPISRENQINNILVPNKNDYRDRGQYEFLRHSFINDLVSHCNHIISALTLWEVPSNHSIIVTMIRDLWKKFSDFSLLCSIFRSKTDLIILCGEKHAENLRIVLKSSIKSQSFPLVDGCINLCIR